MNSKVHLEYLLAAAIAVLFMIMPVSSNPVLVPGTWVGIGPQMPAGEVWYVRVDPNNPDVVYAITCQQGLVRTTDAGSTWNRVSAALSCATGLEIDPSNSQHMYICYAFDAAGFWETTDGGTSWIQHPTPVSSDIGLFRVDPSDFQHILVSYHYCPSDTIAFVESTDGGNTWKIHHVPGLGYSGTKGVHFLSNPKLGIGNGRTWLVVPEGGQMYRTSDAGATWTPVAQGYGGPHGGDKSTYYTNSGMLYIPAVPNPVRSRDNGITWESTNLPNSYYTCIVGDGNTLYTTPDGGSVSSIYTSPENDGLHWTPGTQNFGRGATDMAYDEKNHIMYAANRAYGIFALKVNDANTGMFLSNATATPSSFFDNQSATVELSIDASAQGTISSVTIDASPIGGGSSVAMTKQSGNTYTASITVQSGISAGDKALLVTEKDNANHTLYGSIRLSVLFHDQPVLIPDVKTAVASSIQDASCPAAAVIDQNTGTRWSSGGGDPQWIYVDLGSPMKVTRVVLTWEAAYAKSYQIQVSTYATNWTDVFSTTSGNGSTDTITFDQSTARYVRMYGTQRGTTFGYSLYEFQIFAPAPSTTVHRAIMAKPQNGLVNNRIAIISHRAATSNNAIVYDMRGNRVNKKDMANQVVIIRAR